LPDDYSCTGVLYTFTKALARPIKPLGEWNTLEITLDGPHTVVFLNGVKVTDFKEGTLCPQSLPVPSIQIEDRGKTPATSVCKIIPAIPFTSRKFL